MKNGKPNFVIKNATENKAELYIYSDIVSDEYEGWWTGSDVYPDAVKQFLDSVKGKNLDVYINSNGGSVMSALAIYNMLQRHIDTGHTVTTYVDGIAASSASFLAMVGANSGGLYMPENAFLMVHRAWVQTWGNSQDLRNMADTLDKIDESILSIYEKNLKDGVDIQTIKELITNETWMSGKEAVQYFNIHTTSSIEAVACVTDISHKNMPSDVIKKSEEVANLSNLTAKVVVNVDEDMIHKVIDEMKNKLVSDQKEIENLLMQIELL